MKKNRIVNSLLCLMIIFIVVTLLNEKAEACNYECAIVCNDISVSCLNANPYDPYEDPWGRGEHIDVCRNLYDLCMVQAFLQ